MFKESLQLIALLSIIIFTASTIISLQENFQGVEYFILLIVICILITLWASVIRLFKF